MNEKRRQGWEKRRSCLQLEVIAAFLQLLSRTPCLFTGTTPAGGGFCFGQGAENEL